MIQRITDYLRNKVSSFRKWDAQRSLEWVTWNWKHGFVAVITNDNKILGVGIARPVKDIEMAEDAYYFDESGDILFVDMLAADEQFAINVLMSEAIKRFGKKTFYAFKKSKFSDKVRMNKTERLIRRLDYCC